MHAKIKDILICIILYFRFTVIHNSHYTVPCNLEQIKYCIMLHVQCKFHTATGNPGGGLRGL